jgi:hypothetical protein
MQRFHKFGTNGAKAIEFRVNFYSLRKLQTLKNNFFGTRTLKLSPL